MTAYKLFRERKDGTLGPLFINPSQRIPYGEWLPAESHPTSGFAFRPGWHALPSPSAPHLSPKGRVWAKVEVDDFTIHQRPGAQGGQWILANKMKVLEKVS